MATLYSSREVALARAALPAPKCGNELWPKADAHLPLRAYRGAIARLQPVVLTFRRSGKAGLRLSTSVSGLGRVSRASPVQTAMRNCTRDEGGPFGFGDQEL